jgi:hypothetical protein
LLAPIAAQCHQWNRNIIFGPNVKNVERVQFLLPVNRAEEQTFFFMAHQLRFFNILGKLGFSLD